MVIMVQETGPKNDLFGSKSPKKVQKMVLQVQKNGPKNGPNITSKMSEAFVRFSSQN